MKIKQCMNAKMFDCVNERMTLYKTVLKAG